MKTRARSTSTTWLLVSGLLAFGGASIAQTAPTGTPQGTTPPRTAAPNPATPQPGNAMTNNGPTAQQTDPQGAARGGTYQATQQANQPLNGRNGVPTRSDTAANAFRMLDPSNRGYITKSDADRIPGFQGFDSADADRDGHLTPQEFANAWKSYSGQ